MSDKKWYYAENNERKGPVTQEELRSLIVRGELPKHTLVWTAGQASWTSACELMVFASAMLKEMTREQALGNAPQPAYAHAQQSSNHQPQPAHQAANQSQPNPSYSQPAAYPHQQQPTNFVNQPPQPVPQQQPPVYPQPQQPANFVNQPPQPVPQQQPPVYPQQQQQQPANFVNQPPQPVPQQQPPVYPQQHQQPANFVNQPPQPVPQQQPPVYPQQQQQQPANFVNQPPSVPYPNAPQAQRTPPSIPTSETRQQTAPDNYQDGGHSDNQRQQRTPLRSPLLGDRRNTYGNEEGELFPNNSGRGPEAILPPNATGLNWGAFCFPWLWGLCNGTYIALLCLLPGVNLIMPFIMLVKGNEWAWRNRRWQNIDHFIRVQRRWGMAAACVLILALGSSLATSLFGGLQETLSAAKSNVESQLNDLDSKAGTEKVPSTGSGTPDYAGAAAADDLMDQKKYGDAEELYRKAIAANPNNAYLHYRMATCLANQNKLHESVKEAESAEKLDPLSEPIAEYVGLCMVSAGMQERAAVHHEKAFKRFPSYAYLAEQAGCNYRDSGNTEKALTYFKAAAKAAPWFEQNWINWAKLLKDSGEDKQAKAVLTQGLAYFPESERLRALAN